MLPFDLKDIENESQKSLTKTFKKLPQDTEGIITILKTFLADKNKQTPEILNVPLDDLEGKKLSVTFVGNREFIQNNIETLLQQEPMLYYKTDDGVSIPAERIMANSVRSIQEIDAELLSGEKLRSYRSLENEDEATINIENFLFFYLKKDNIKIDFTVRKQNTFAKIMTVLEKMDDIIANGIKIFNYHFEIGDTKTDDLKTFEEAFNDIYNFFKKLDLLFSKIKLNKELNYFELEDGEKNLLQELVFIFEKNLPENPLMRTITLDGNVYYLLISHNNIYNMFYINDTVAVQSISEDAEYQVVPSLIPRENLDKVVDFDYKQIYQDIVNLYTEDNAPNDYVNQYLLDIILSYDYSLNEDFYRLAELVSELLIEKDASIVSKINYLQVILRKREFSVFEKKQLEEMYYESTDSLVKINIKILLGKSVEKDIQLLDATDRENLKNWPIYNLVEKQKNV